MDSLGAMSRLGHVRLSDLWNTPCCVQTGVRGTVCNNACYNGADAGDATVMVIMGGGCFDDAGDGNRDGRW